MHLDSPFLGSLSRRTLVLDGAMGTQIQAAELAAEDFALRATGVRCTAPGVGRVASGHSDRTDNSDRTPTSDVVLAAAGRLEGKPLDGCNEILNLTRPDVIEKIHRDYFAAGADAVETNTFGCTSIVLAEYDIPELTYELGLAAALIARKAADAASTRERPRFVIGAIGPGTKLVSLGQTTFDEIESTYSDCFRATIVGGADALLVETAQDLLMLKAALVGAIRAMEESGRRVPLMAQVTMEQTGTMLLGSEIGAALNMLEAFPEVQVIGINCATGPVEMAPHVRFLSQNSTRPISVLPNAGLPVMEGGRGVYKLSPKDLAAHHKRFVEDLGVAIVGGCCGTTPDHIEAIAASVSGEPNLASVEPGGGDAHWKRVRQHFPGFDFRFRPSSSAEQSAAMRLVGCSSLYQFQPYLQDASFLIVGEKTNANGSRAFRDMLAAENWEGLTELARELEGEGSHVLDVCTAFVGRDESSDMRELLPRYNRHVTVPIMIDSTEAPVVEEALKCLAGKPIVNSINFEDGEARTEQVLRLCGKYGAGIVALTIDEDGMAKTADKKVAIAERILDRTRGVGLPDHDLFLDCLTFTLGSGDEEFRRSAIESIEAIREVRRRHPRVNAILGVSNVSFGLKPSLRVILNSTFLHYALEAGLTSAIVHFSKIKPENQIETEIWQLAEDLVFDRRRFAAAS